MVSTAKGHMEIVQSLINAGATVNDKNNYVRIINAFAFVWLFEFFVFA